MKTSKELIIKSGIIPKLILGKKTPKGTESTGPHRVKMLEDRIIKGVDPRSGKEMEYVEYTVEEKGTKKIYKTKLRGNDNMPSYLVQRLSEVNEGEEIIMEMKKSGMKNFIDVSDVKDTDSIEIEDEDHEVNELEEEIPM